MNKKKPLNSAWFKAVISDRFSLPFSICNTFEVQFLENAVNILVTKEIDLNYFKKDKLETLEKQMEMAIIVGVK